MIKHGLPGFLAALIVFIGLISPVQAEDRLPAEIQDALGELIIIRTAYWDSPESTWFVFARTPHGANILLCFVQENNAWIRSFYTIAAVPQGEDAVEFLPITQRMKRSPGKAAPCGNG